MVDEIKAARRTSALAVPLLISHIEVIRAQFSLRRPNQVAQFEAAGHAHFLTVDVGRFATFVLSPIVSMVGHSPRTCFGHFFSLSLMFDFQRTS